MKMPSPTPLGYDSQGDLIEGFTEEQMKQYGRDLLESAAVEAEDADNIVDGKGYYQQGGDANATAVKIAAAIRSMKEKL